MAYKNADWIKETTATTGIGPLTLAGAAGLDSGTFGSALNIGDTCSYAVISSTGVERETGIGTRTASNILDRTIVKSSTNGGSLVDFGVGIKTVHLGPIAGTQIPYDPVTGALNLSVNALNDVAITSPTVNQVLKYSGTEWTNQTDAVNVGTVTSVAATGGTGISVTGSPITGAGTLAITNTAPDQTVSLTAGTGISATGTYPNFTITNTAPSSGGTVTSVSVSSANGFGGTVATATSTPAITLTTSITGVLKGNASAILAAVAGTDYVTPSGSVAYATSAGSATNANYATAAGNAASVTTNANLTGHVTSVGNAAVLGSFTSAQLAGALSDETGTGANVFATSPTLVTPLSNSLSAVPVASGAGNSLTIAAGSGIGTGSGANLVLNPGEFATSGTRGTVLIDGLNVGKGKGTNKNTVIGEGALNAVTTGDGNIACGYQSLYTNAGGIGNVACGYQALYAMLNGNDNVGIGTQSLRFNISGNENIACGYQSLLLSTASSNTSIGVYSGRTLTTGSNNTFLGFSAGYNASQLVSATNSMALGNNSFTTASNQVVIGNTSVTQIILNGTATTNAIAAIPVTSGAGNSLTIAAGSGVTSGAGANLILNPGEQVVTGGRGTVLIDGLNAGKGKGSATNNTVFGVGALAVVTTGYQNVAVGNDALAANTIGADNIAIGLNAIKNATGFSYSNIAIGGHALSSSGTYNYNVAIGAECLSSTTGNRNIAIGGFTCAQTNSGSGSIYIGVEAGRITNANNNVVIGNAAGFTGTYLTSGTNNTLLGSFIDMGTGNETATNCIIIGKSAIGNGTNTTTIGNSSTTATYLYGTIAAVPRVGTGAGNSLTIAAGSGVTSGAGGSLILNPGEQATTGGRGTVLIDGLNAGKGKGTGANNAIFGIEAYAANTTGYSNIAIGYRASYSNTGGAQNTAIGYHACYSNTGGNNNTAIGQTAMNDNTDGSSNTAIGRGALLGNTTGNLNTVTGTQALYQNGAGSNNTANGTFAGYSLTAGSNNTFLGYSAGYNASQLASAQNSMALGNGSFTTASNQVVIGNTSVTQIILNGTATTNAIAAIPVASGAGNSLTIAAGSGVTSGAGGSLILQAGLQATSGGDGKINFNVGSLIVGSIESFSTTGGKLTLGDGFFTKVNGQNFSFNSGGLFSGVVSFTASITGGNGTVDGPSYLVDNNGKGHYFYSTSGISTLIGAFAKNGLIIIGGKTSSFPGLKRSGTQIQVRLADDSADASLSASNFVANALSAMPVTNGAGNSVTIAAGAGVGTGAGGSLILQAGLQATSGGDGKVIVKQVAGQTSNLQEWQNSAGTVLASVSAAGSLEIYSATTADLLKLTVGANANAGILFQGGGTSASLAAIRAIDVSGYNGDLAFYTDNDGASTSSLTERMRILSAGNVGIGTTSPSARTHIVTAAATKGLIVQGAASQTANLQEWQNSAGTALASVDAAGSLRSTSLSFPSATTAIAANTNDLALTASAFQRLNCTSASNLTGIAPPSAGTHVDGRMIRVYNVGAANLTLTHNSGLSTAANRYWNSTAADIVLATNDYAELIYDSTSNGSGAAGWRAS